MSGSVCARRPPSTMALMGTPSGPSQSESMIGHWDAGAVNRAFGWAAVRPEALPISGVQASPRQSRHSAGGSGVIPSHHTPPWGVSATLVKIELRDTVAMALGLVAADVPGATPKTPASGLMARRWPFSSGLIHAMSSPTIETFQPSIASGGTSIARFVFTHAEGNEDEM